MLRWVFNLESDLHTESARNNCLVVVYRSYLHPGIEAFSVSLLKIFLWLEDNLVQSGFHFLMLQSGLIGSSWR